MKNLSKYSKANRCSEEWGEQPCTKRKSKDLAKRTARKIKQNRFALITADE